MKKVKNYLSIIILGVFTCVIGLGAFLASQAHGKNDVSEQTLLSNTSSVTPTLLAASTSAVSDKEINDYISSKEEDVLVFYQWFMNTYDWKHYTEDNVIHPFLETYTPDEDGYVDYAASMQTIELKKGNVYLFNGYDRSQSNYTDYQRATAFANLYGLFSSGKKFTTYASTEELNIELEDDYNYAWDNTRICSEIDSRFKRKIDQVYGAYPNYHEDYKKSDAFIIVPKEDITLTMTSDQEILKKHSALYLDLLVGRILENDYQAPSINGTVHLSVNVSNQPSIETILSYVQAVDETDGVVPVKLEEEGTTYIPGEMAIGDYELHISATDSSSNTAYQTIYIHRFDSDKPVISGTSSYTVNYNNDLTLDKITAALSISDNIDKDLTLNLVSDNFTANKNRLGTYQIVFNTKDRSNNTSDNFTVVVVVRNEGTPVITAPTEITISISKLLTLEEFKAKVSVVDGYDGVINDYVIEGYDSYASSYTKVGTNDVTISKTNSGNHTAQATVRFIKIDDQKPVIYFNNGYFVSLAEGEIFTIEQFKTQAASVLHLDINQIVDIEGTYDTATIGNYDLIVCLSSGEQESFRVFVGEEAKPADEAPKEEVKPSFFNRVQDFYKDNATVAWSITAVSLLAIVLLAVVVVLIIKKHR